LWTSPDSGHGPKTAPVASLVHHEGRSGETNQFEGLSI
jgi:hypothetical protein